MTRNDMIAEYVREKRPEIITSADFAIFAMKKALEEFISGIKK